MVSGAEAMYTIKDIRDCQPCYDPLRYISEDWVGTERDILLAEQVPVKDRIWLILRLRPDIAVEFAEDCANRAKQYDAADAADAADDAAYAYAAAAYAARAAAVYATADAAAAADAAYAAAAYAARVAAVYAAYAAAAADAAAADADAAYAAADAAYAAERNKQIQSLLRLTERNRVV